MKLEVINPKIFALSRIIDENEQPWQPGDFCRAWHDRRSLGLIISVNHDEELLTLWSIAPHSPSGYSNTAQSQQIRDEEDTQILRDLQALLSHDQDV